ncbi:carboxylate-amine ligase [Actinoplanes regularis]|uniref:Putative glutamate--cysteine ligase 2 n=1 Tax=Actinoplanes regularis TaxID=52697 RepID=A0A239GYP6_9ACTN|nr:glutamate--cysteine ligase [Actinoplanes regularis]GIE90908.1 putative glutamate--cysteine ligase 2 [Actinoplanes regularis]SNS73144.1 carboxylate-amine ligase [Actinoplanes regularis]
MRTFGVEEEFLLLDPASGVNLPLAERVVAGLPEPMRRRSRREFRPSMVEMVTDVCTGTGELLRQLHDGREAAGVAAGKVGAALVAIGATPAGEPVLDVTDDARFRAIAAHYRPIARDPALCGCHVHVGVPSRAQAVQICTRLRGDLPLIQALAANSPLFDGADTGYASWRYVQLKHWPALGPWPHLRTVEEFEATVAALVASREMMDATMLLWWARPSASFPTVEVRVADTCLDPADTVLIAALVRGLVDTAAAAPGPIPRMSGVLLDAAHGNAARTGMRETLLDPVTGQAYPAWDLVGDLVDRITPALRRHGDLDTVTAGLDRIRRDGTGAERQRRLLEKLAVPEMLASVAQ